MKFKGNSCGRVWKYSEEREEVDFTEPVVSVYEVLKQRNDLHFW